MNKKTVMIASGVVGLILATSACGGETYEYQVSGPIEGQQIDYDCPGEDIAMDAVAFVTGKGGGGKKSSNSSDSDSTDSGGSTTTNRKQDRSSGTTSSKAPSTSTSKAPSRAPSTSTSTGPRSASPKASQSVANKGASLKSKPEKPEKLKTKKLPKLKYKFKPKGCETEYEIFVWGKGGYLYEQDVRKVDYDKCLAAKVKAGQKAKLFPLCTKG
ncbi:hypothetical protein SEA_KRADAL_117 [Streptomyces phage Kradal]|nr:hypothetical protein SEA_KRADAL_117 [Streptomyces phage Kradal]